MQSLLHKAPCNFLSVLGMAQWRKIDFLPITWQPAMEQIGRGGSARIQQSPVNLQIDFAFKRLSLAAESLSDENALYRALTTEIGVLGHHRIADHPSILKLEGICWDIDPCSEKVYPALVFEKAVYGDLGSFKTSELFQNFDVASKMLLCAHVANAVADMHSCGEERWYVSPRWYTADNHQGIVHGDIKPANVLVHHENNNTVSAKVADFGFSAMSSSNKLLFLPRSVPWNAPEWHRRGFSFDQALRQDIFSFGLLCLWLLLPAGSDPDSEDTLDFDNRQPRTRWLSFENIDNLEALKSADELCLAATLMVKSLKGLDNDQTTKLEALFNHTLSLDPSNRICNLHELFPLLHQDLAKDPATSIEDVLEVIPTNLEIDFKVGLWFPRNRLSCRLRFDRWARTSISSSRQIIEYEAT